MISKRLIESRPLVAVAGPASLPPCVRPARRRTCSSFVLGIWRSLVRPQWIILNERAGHGLDQGPPPRNLTFSNDNPRPVANRLPSLSGVLSKRDGQHALGEPPGRCLAGKGCVDNLVHPRINGSACLSLVVTSAEINDGAPDRPFLAKPRESGATARLYASVDTHI